MELHEELRAGEARHVAFSRSEWERSLRDPAVVARWTHAPGDCCTPRESLNRHRAARGLAPLPPPTGAVDPPMVAPVPVAVAVLWPPSSPLRPEDLVAIGAPVGLPCARQLLAGPKKERPPAVAPRSPAVAKKPGKPVQLGLF